MKTRTLHMSVTFAMTCVANAGVFSDIAIGREKARARTPEAVAELDKGELFRHNLLVSDATDEEVLINVLRMSTRDFMRENIAREFSGGGFRAKMGDVKVSVKPKGQREPAVVPAVFE